MSSPGPSRADGNTHPPPPLRGYGVAGPIPTFAAVPLSRSPRTRLRCSAARTLAAVAPRTFAPSHPRTLAPSHPYAVTSPGFHPRLAGKRAAASDGQTRLTLEKAYMTTAPARTRTRSPSASASCSSGSFWSWIAWGSLEASTDPTVLAGRAGPAGRQHDGPGDAAGTRPVRTSGLGRHLPAADCSVCRHAFERRSAAPPETAERRHIFALLGGDRRTSRPNIPWCEMTSIMGGAQLDLRQAKLAPAKKRSSMSSRSWAAGHLRPRRVDRRRAGVIGHGRHQGPTPGRPAPG